MSVPEPQAVGVCVIRADAARRHGDQDGEDAAQRAPRGRHRARGPSGEERARRKMSARHAHGRESFWTRTRTRPDAPPVGSGWPANSSFENISETEPHPQARVTPRAPVRFGETQPTPSMGGGRDGSEADAMSPGSPGPAVSMDGVDESFEDEGQYEPVEMPSALLPEEAAVGSALLERLFEKLSLLSLLKVDASVQVRPATTQQHPVETSPPPTY